MKKWKKGENKKKSQIGKNNFVCRNIVSSLRGIITVYDSEESIGTLLLGSLKLSLETWKARQNSSL